MPVTFKLQCSPYKEVTSKIYLLKQDFLQSANPLEGLLKLNKLF